MGGDDRGLRLTARNRPRAADAGSRTPDDRPRAADAEARTGDAGPRAADVETGSRAHGLQERTASGARPKRVLRRDGGEYARRSMLSSAEAHDRAADLLEDMAAVHPEEAEAHLQTAERHRRWAEIDRDLVERYASRRGSPDGL